VEYNNIEAIKKATTSKTCAVLLELIQAEGGVIVPDDGYLKQVRAWCDEKGILLILDEIQTGMGRLGKLFGYELYGIEPDVITLAKGIASGVAIGVVMAKDKASVFAPGEHGSTFGGNPLACAAGYAVTQYLIENRVAENAGRVGQYLKEKLIGLKQKYPVIADVRGCGLLIGLEFKKDIAEAVMYACMEKGLLVNHLKSNLLRFIPPLIVDKTEIDTGIRVIDEVLSGFEK
jgi:acetylornithine/succinyldiaminopimelate/putrescine aminotransferase